jgi:zona occludens toxin
MAIWIHHGAPGSYKSSGAISSDVLPAIKEGRFIITNVRGFSAERCRKILKPSEIGEGFDVMHIDTDHVDGRDKLARFFHWAPKGAFFLIDECQRVFPPSWSAADVKKLDYPGGPQLANAAGRPETIQTAWDMHRHHNWDFVLTCPNISQVRNEIKAPAETAIRHVNMAILGLRGYYKSVLHTSDCSGASAAHSLQTKAFNKVSKRIFQLYDSTVTGATRDTAAGSSILRDPKILGLLFLLGCCLYWGFIRPKMSQNSNHSASAVSHSASSAPVAVSSDISPAGGVGAVGVSSGVSGAASDDYMTFRTGPFAGYRLVITCRVMVRNGRSVSMQHCYSLSKDGAYYDIDLDDYPSLFSAVKPVDDCLSRIGYDGHVYQAMCDPAYEAWAASQQRLIANPSPDTPLLAKSPL